MERWGLGSRSVFELSWIPIAFDKARPPPHLIFANTASSPLALRLGRSGHSSEYSGDHSLWRSGRNKCIDSFSKGKLCCEFTTG